MFPQKPRQKIRGFTLIEVVVAMAILGIVTIMIFSLLGYNLNAFSQSSAAVDEQSSLRLAAYKLTNKLRNIGYIDLGNGSFADTSAIQAVSATDHFIFLSDDGLKDGDFSSISSVSDAEIKSVLFSLRGSNEKYFLGITLSGSTDTYTTEVLLNNIVTNSAVQMGSFDMASAFSYIQYNYNEPPAVSTSASSSSSSTPSDVSVASISVQWQNNSNSISADGGTLQMTASVLPVTASNQSVTWSVSNTDYATIDSSGVLKAKNNGSVIVTATAMDGSGHSGWAEITISGQTTTPLQITNVPDGEITIHKGSKYTYTLEIEGGTPGYSCTFSYPNDGGTVSISDNSITWNSPNGNNKTLTFSAVVTDQDGNTAKTGDITVKTTN